MYRSIPDEMKLYRQWVVWRYEETDSAKPTKVPYSAMTNRLAKVNDPETWTTFDQAVHAASGQFYNGIGFVLTEDDPFAFIDLDDTEGDQQALDRQLKIYNEFNSYAERSPSGNGLHIILRGQIPTGRKRSKIEIYSSDRYMTMTGNVYRDLPISEHNDLLNMLWVQMAEGRKASQFYAGLAEAKLSNEEVMQIASNAANNEKFNELYYNGNWQLYYPSQSEADFALVDILAFYSENRHQVQELFLSSALGQREKSRAQYRINYMLNRCFDRMLPPVDIDGLKMQLEEAMLARDKKPALSMGGSAEEPEPVNAKPLEDVYSVPPGLVGEIAQYIYAQAPRPVPEIALAGALGLMSGIVGRAYNVSGTGLNQYVLLLAPTGTGKEAIAGGIDKLMGAVVRTVPAAVDFIGPGKISSEQALIKYLSKTACSFVSTVGEFGIQLKLMSSPFASPHMQGLLSMFLDLFNKSGEGKILRPSIYSDREKNTNSVLAPAFSLIGESTPEKFYEALDESMISSGLLPRFTAIEYRGNRPPLNPGHIHAKPSFELIDRLSTVCAHALMLNSQHKAINVISTPDAKAIFDKFDVHCDQNINSSEREVRRHLWNRAHIKALKLAAVVAVGNNPYDPEITPEIANWAINLIVADVRNLLSRFDAGEIGVDNDETKQLMKAVSTIKDFVTLPWNEVVKYAGESQARLHGDRIIPYSYLQRRLASVAVFKKDRVGSSVALKRALKTLMERGDLQEVSRATLSKDYSTTALCYMISNAPAFAT